MKQVLLPVNFGSKIIRFNDNVNLITFEMSIDMRYFFSRINLIRLAFFNTTKTVCSKANKYMLSISSVMMINVLIKSDQ